MIDPSSSEEDTDDEHKKTPGNCTSYIINP